MNQSNLGPTALLGISTGGLIFYSLLAGGGWYLLKHKHPAWGGALLAFGVPGLLLSGLGAVASGVAVANPQQQTSGVFLR